jgi:hypothetical protein
MNQIGYYRLFYRLKRIALAYDFIGWCSSAKSMDIGVRAWHLMLNKTRIDGVTR